MAFPIVIHYDNALGFPDPRLHVWNPVTGHAHTFAATGRDGDGPVFAVDVPARTFGFMFRDAGGGWEPRGLERGYASRLHGAGHLDPPEVWCVAAAPFVYDVRPRPVEPQTAAEFLRTLTAAPGVFVPDTGGRSAFGATLLASGEVLFGFYHPSAAQVYVMGSFNDWQRPERPEDHRDGGPFIAMRRYRGHFGAANTWLAVCPTARVGDEYKFYVRGGVPDDHKARPQRYVHDPYARELARDFHFNNPVIVDPAQFAWSDTGWSTPSPDRLILYELSVFGFTEGDHDIPAEMHGRFEGITERIRLGYFDALGVTALSIMPLAEVPTPQGPTALGYEPSLFFTMERDFGGPDDFRALVDTAHAHGLAVLVDQVFNHTSNGFNPLWQMVLEHPEEARRSDEGGLYFSGATPWGNRLATEKDDVQNMLIDSCKLLIREYHVDGFRLDATHTNYMDHRFLHRLADELKALKPDVILVAENLPNQPDLNRAGFDGYAQWCDLFHDKVKALLREGPFGDRPNDPEGLGTMFYFSRQEFAAHTNNVVNFCESHDETSIAYEAGTNAALDHPAAKDRKGRLGLFATMTALGQPMIYMGQEFNVERDRNQISFAWPTDLHDHGFFQWARRLMRLRRRYPGLRLFGYDPAATGQFDWILAPWLDGRHGGGRRVIGWRSRPNASAHEAMVVLLNFEGSDVTVDLELGLPGVWVKLADIDRVNDLPPDGTNSAADPTALRSGDGRFGGFTLPSSSGFVYKWESGG
jgi:1,4-alpha-glucan branching enzyme